ncbi:MAG: HlyD family type I secretion periplasmic adaptor subunit [Candidatus Methylumidiphilus sp.]
MSLQANLELAQRYWQAFRRAWRQRAELDAPKRLPHEAQFLPAALALQETPLSPAPHVAMWLLIAFAASALAWSVFGQIDVVATAEGKTVSSGRIKLIQSLETAKVQAIHVTDGQTVKAGDVLVELDAADAHADRERVAFDLATARLQAARARALLAALDSGQPPPWQVLPTVPQAQWRDAGQLLQSQYAEYRARRARLDTTIQHREAERHSSLERIHKLEQTAPLARQRADDMKNLVERKYVARHDWLQSEQTRLEQEGDLAVERSHLLEIDAALREAEDEKRSLDAETRRVNQQALNDSTQQAAALEQALIKTNTRERLTRLTAPVAGAVQQLAVHTVGGVVTEAQALMAIVPADNPIEVEAFIQNKDIGFVKPGQPAELKIETFPYTKYGTLHAEVASVSHDAINDDKRGLVYSCRVKLRRTTIQVDGAEVRLGSGMAVAVEIKTGKRRVIEYFLSPLIQYRHESFIER